MIYMKKKLVDGSDVSPECRNCIYSRPFSKEGFILCEKSGIRSITALCKKYKYNPLNRVPSRMPDITELSKEDFSL